MKLDRRFWKTGPNMLSARNKPQVIISQKMLVVFGTAEYSEYLDNDVLNVGSSIPHDRINLNLVLTMDKNFCRYEGNFLAINFR